MNELQEKTVLEHISDMRKFLLFAIALLLLGWLCGYALYPKIIVYLLAPLRTAGVHAGAARSLAALSVFEGFLLRVKASFVSGIVLFVPLHIVNIFIFIGPALKKREKRVFFFSVAAGSLLAVLAVLYSYRWIIPLSISFLTSPHFLPSQTGLLLAVGKNAMYIMQFLLAGVLVFQLPVVVCALLAAGLVTVNQVLSASRFVILGAFVFAAILTPPDVLSQILLALPLIILYYISAGIGFLFRSRKDDEKAGED